MDHVDKVLAQWRRERPDLELVPMGILGRLKRLHARVAEELARVFSAHGLNAAGFDVLATLRRAGAPHALSPTALIDWTMVTSATMTNRLDRLEQAGLVERRRNPDDGRALVVALTPKGFDLIDSIMAEHVANQHRIMQGLSPQMLGQIDDGLRAWLAALDAGTSMDQAETGRQPDPCSTVQSRAPRATAP